MRTAAGLLAGLWMVAGAAQPTAPVDSQAILVDGSSTVGPVTEGVAADFLALAPRARISVGVSGTSGGFRRFPPGKRTSTTPRGRSDPPRSARPRNAASSTWSS